MGFNTYEMRKGVAFTPTPGDLASLFSDWRPRHSAPEDLDVPGSDARYIIPWAATKVCRAHLDLTGEYAPNFRRIS